MVFIGGWRTRRPRYGPYPPGYGPYSRPGYGYRGGGGCLRDLFLLQTGCCLAEMIGCGPQLALLGPSLVRRSFWATRRGAPSTCPSGSPAVRFAVAAIGRYQEEISAKRTQSCCRYAPSCSVYAQEALERHGLSRGLWLTARRLLRCRPGTRGGFDPVPAADV